MIVFDLRCHKDHVFEAWFASSEAFDEQSKAGAVACPLCGSAKVAKALMAPAVAGTRKSDEPTPRAEGAEGSEPAQQTTYFNALKELRAHVENTCDYVGPNFAEEARKMHYGEAEKRNIYGEATERQAKSLREEGVDCHQIPWLPNQDG
jgi:hypothetical protein